LENPANSEIEVERAPRYRPSPDTWQEARSAETRLNRKKKGRPQVAPCTLSKNVFYANQIKAKSSHPNPASA
jgi:hypothetical protein